MISGIKREKTAVESTVRFFQTVDLIINHFKRDADKQKIFELVTQEFSEETLKDLLIATAAIHLYHNLGIRVEESTKLEQISVKSTKNLELMEKKILADEVNSILKDSLNLEIDMLNKMIYLENKIISFLIKDRITELKELERKTILDEIEDHIEQVLLEIVLSYPPFYFYDLLGDLIGLTNEIKVGLLEKGSAFKELSVEIERKLEIEEKEDKFIELSTLNKLIKKLQSDFEFKSYKELQMHAMAVRMIKRRVMDYNINRFPISIPGLNTFLEANKIKKQLIDKIEDALKKKIDYEQFEENMVSFLKSEMLKKLKTNPNDFIYFLESLNESNFNEIMYMLNKHGVYNILHLINVDNDLAQKIKENMIRYNIDKANIISLNKKKKNLIYLIKKELCDLNFPILNDIVKRFDESYEFSIIRVLNQDSEEIQKLWKILEAKIGYSLKDFREYIRKKEIIDKVFLSDLKLKNYSQILLLLSFEDIMNNLAKDIFYYIFSKIVRQIGRIIELYLKVTNDKTLYLIALKKMYGTTESEEWVWIKLEELIIDRIIKRQEELVIVFNAMDQPLLINGFIFARMVDKSLNEGIKEFEDKPSPIYEGISSIKLKTDIISPVSYCLAFDLIKRFENFEESRKSKVEKIIETKEKKIEVKKKELRKQQEISTLNWIERRITSSLMRINSPGINPNQLYWQKKDQKTATDNIKLHSEKKGLIIDMFTEYFHFAIEKIRSFAPDVKFPEREKLQNFVVNTTNDMLKKRLGRIPSENDIKNMLEGERFEIARQIASRIGKLLDKALYNKFKSKKR